MSEEALTELAHRAGILPAYHDLSGFEHVTPPETIRALLRSMGHDTEPDAIARYLAQERADDAARALDPTLVIEAERDCLLTTRVPGAIAWRLIQEDGTVQEGLAQDCLPLPAMPVGYHRLEVVGYTTLIFAAPQRAPSIQDRSGRDRIWGVTTGIYGLRSSRNLGIGDYADLRRLATTLASRGADFLGINPVHARGVFGGDSPYSPSHRQFVDTRHIAVDEVPEFAHCVPARRLLDQHGAALRELREADLIDYPRVYAILRPMLDALFVCFERAPEERRDAFNAFRASRGQTLRNYCLFEALSERHGGHWQCWPEALLDPNGEAARAFEAEHGREIRYHAYLQWIAEEQLQAAQQAARGAGMALGLYTDLAVGVRPDGAEPWAGQGLFAPDVSLGVPPDYFNPNGQTWGLAPFNPRALRAAAYRPFIDTIRAVVRHAGMIRIDHAIGLQRCFWVPKGGDPEVQLPGAYVSYPLDVLLAIIRIEAARGDCVIVGEDLGVVPEGLRERLAESGLYGCAVMQFERYDDSSFRHPAHYRSDTVASIGTHDTPTLSGFWEGRDIEERRRIGQIPDDAADAQHHGRAADRHHFRRLANAAHGELDGPMPGAMGLAIHATLAHRASAMAAIQLDDILGVTHQPNMPGTTNEYPNWRVRCPVSLEEIATDPRLDYYAQAVAVGEEPSYSQSQQD